MNTIKVLFAVLLGILGLSSGTILAQTGPNIPIASSVVVTDVTETSATIIWATDGPSNGLVHFGPDIESLHSKVFNPALVTHHAETLGDLTPNSRYMFQVQMLDAQGNVVSDDKNGGIYRFTTLAPKVRRQVLVGAVVSELGDRITINQHGTGVLVEIVLPPNIAATYAVGPQAGQLKLGARVVILGEQANSVWVVRRVVVKPSIPSLPVTGVLTHVKENTGNILSPDGISHTLTFPDESKQVAVGDLVTAFPDASGSVRGLVKASELRQRLTRFLVAISASEIKSTDDLQGQHASRLIKILDQQISLQEQIIDTVLSRAPEEAQGAISISKEEIEQYALDSLDIKASVRAKFGLEEEAPNQGQSSSNSGLPTIN